MGKRVERILTPWPPPHLPWGGDLTPRPPPHLPWPCSQGRPRARRRGRRGEPRRRDVGEGKRGGEALFRGLASARIEAARAAFSLALPPAHVPAPGFTPATSSTGTVPVAPPKPGRTCEQGLSRGEGEILSRFPRGEGETPGSGDREQWGTEKEENSAEKNGNGDFFDPWTCFSFPEPDGALLSLLCPLPHPLLGISPSPRETERGPGGEAPLRERRRGGRGVRR